MPQISDIRRMTWGPTVISWAIDPNYKRRHDGWELSELTGRRIIIDKPLKNTARGELEAPVAIDPRQRVALVELNLHSAGVKLSPHIPHALLIQALSE